MRMKARDFTKRLFVKFRGEDGLDYGGIARYKFYTYSKATIAILK